MCQVYVLPHVVGGAAGVKVSTYRCGPGTCARALFVTCSVSLASCFSCYPSLALFLTYNYAPALDTEEHRLPLGWRARPRVGGSPADAYGGALLQSHGQMKQAANEMGPSGRAKAWLRMSVL